jgi:hypothetical protein
MSVRRRANQMEDPGGGHESERLQVGNRRAISIVHDVSAAQVRYVARRTPHPCRRHSPTPHAGDERPIQPCLPYSAHGGL